MSTTHEALLMACCVVPGGLIEDAIQALDISGSPDLRDLAWEVVNDRTGVINIDHHADQPFYLGAVLAAGNTDGDTCNGDRLRHDLLLNLAYWRDKLTRSLKGERHKSPDPQFHAFVDWLIHVAKTSDSWGWRLLPTRG